MEKVQDSDSDSEAEVISDVKEEGNGDWGHHDSDDGYDYVPNQVVRKPRGRPKGKKGISKSPKPQAKKRKITRQPQPTVTAKEDKDNYEIPVFKILDVRTLKNGKREFEVQRKSWAVNDSTWEPEAHLNCKNLVKEFLEKKSVRDHQLTMSKSIPVRVKTHVSSDSDSDNDDKNFSCAVNPQMIIKSEQKENEGTNRNGRKTSAILKTHVSPDSDSDKYDGKFSCAMNPQMIIKSEQKENEDTKRNGRKTSVNSKRKRNLNVSITSNSGSEQNFASPVVEGKIHGRKSRRISITPSAAQSGGVYENVRDKISNPRPLRVKTHVSSDSDSDKYDEKFSCVVNPQLIIKSEQKENEGTNRNGRKTCDISKRKRNLNVSISSNSGNEQTLASPVVERKIHGRKSRRISVKLFDTIRDNAIEISNTSKLSGKSGLSIWSDDSDEEVCNKLASYRNIPDSEVPERSEVMESGPMPKNRKSRRRKRKISSAGLETRARKKMKIMSPRPVRTSASASDKESKDIQEIQDCSVVVTKLNTDKHVIVSEPSRELKYNMNYPDVFQSLDKRCEDVAVGYIILAPRTIRPFEITEKIGTMAVMKGKHVVVKSFRHDVGRQPTLDVRTIELGGFIVIPAQVPYNLENWSDVHTTLFCVFRRQ